MSRHLNAMPVLSNGRNLPRHAIRLALLLALGIPAAACTAASPGAPFDVGSMATPAPLPQGNIATTTVSGRAFDAGNMAYPQPLPQGDLVTTRFQ